MSSNHSKALRGATAFLFIAGIATAGFFLVGAHSAEHPKPAFKTNGELVRPEGWREWVYVGTPLTPNDLNPPEAAFPEFHNVYIHPADFDHYKRTGDFPDGTVIVKELVSVGSKQAVSGNGYFMGDFVGLEATVKSSKHFQDEPGNWAYFSFGHSYPLADSAAAFPTQACNACHQASAAQDFVFTQYYPVLRSARQGSSKQAASGRVMRDGNETFDAINAAMSGALDSALEASAPTRGVESAVPTEEKKLFTFLKNGEYKDFKARESAAHASLGPHTKVGLPVRVYLDPKLDASLASGATSHPEGSAVVKEMFTAAGELEGWAVAVKTDADSAGGRGWFWYEITNTEDGSRQVAAGNGVPLCFGCHSTGSDFVLTEHPLQ